MKEKIFINGKMVLSFTTSFLKVVKDFYWGLSFTRISRVFSILGYVPYISFSWLLKKEILFKSRLLLLQNILKKHFIFDRLLKRNYQMRTDFLFKSGNYRGLRMRSGLPVKGQAYAHKC